MDDFSGESWLATRYEGPKIQPGFLEWADPWPVVETESGEHFVTVTVTPDLSALKNALDRCFAAIAAKQRGPLHLFGMEAPDRPPSREQRMRAAIEARRNRNTGPRASMRAPKRLDGKGRW